MSGWWAVAAAGAGIFGWAAYLDVRHDADRRLATWWVSRARAWGGWVGPCSLVISAGILAVYGLLALLGKVLAKGLGDPRWALLVAIPAMLAYAPFAFATAPVDPSCYSSWRSDLESAGADSREQRRIAWWAGPPSFVGMILMIATLASIFVS
jgi:hypothetical protein